MRFSNTQLGRMLDEVVAKRTPRKIFPPSMKGGRRAAVLVLGKRGRYVRYRIPVRGAVTDIAIMPTIRAAIMHAVHGKIEIKKTDLREKVRRRKVSILLTLVVDGSSSMLDGERLAALKSILDNIFLDVYQKRDRMAIVHCGGGDANVILSFGGNLEAGRQALDRAPWGGTDNLSQGLSMARECVMHGLRIDKNAIPIVMVLSDGSFPEAEVEELALNLEKVSEKAGVLCVDIGPEAEDEQLGELAQSLEIGYLRSTESPDFDVLPGIDEVRDILMTLSLLMVNPRCGPAVMAGYGPDAVGLAASILQERLWDIEGNMGCPAGCGHTPHPQGYEPELCPVCRISQTIGDLQPETHQVPFVHSKGTDIESLVGSIYVRRFVRPGALSAARNGVLLLSPSVIGSVHERALADAFVLGHYSPSGAWPKFHLPAGNRAAVFIPSTGKSGTAAQVPRLLDGSAVLRCSRRPDRRYSAINLKFRRDAVLSMGAVLRELRVQFSPMLDPLKAATETMHMVRAQDDILELITKACDWLSSSDTTLPGRVLEASRALAALGGRKAVGREDVATALSLLVGSLEPTDDLMDAINHLLLDRLEPLLRSLFTFPTMVIVRGPLPGFHEALLARLSLIAPTIQAMSGCGMHCSPDGADGLCPECEIVMRVGKQDVEQVKAPVVCIDPGTTVQTLASRPFIRFKLVPGTLASAHRGILVIKDTGHVDDGPARFLASSLDQRSSPIEGGTNVHPFSASVIVLVSTGEKVHPAFRSSSPLEIDLTALLDRELLSKAAVRTWVKVADAGTVIPPPPRADMSAAVEVTLAKENHLDMIVCLADALYPSAAGAGMVLLRAARSLASSQGRPSMNERDIGEATSIFTNEVQAIGRP